MLGGGSRGLGEAGGFAVCAGLFFPLPGGLLLRRLAVVKTKRNRWELDLCHFGSATRGENFTLQQQMLGCASTASRAMATAAAYLLCRVHDGVVEGRRAVPLAGGSRVAARPGRLDHYGVRHGGGLTVRH